MLHPDASDEILLGVFERTGAQCVDVMAMPEDRRRQGGPKGTASPEQAATLSAFLWLKAAAQLIERGLLPHDFLDGVLD